jgi:arylsulfatase A-like enzyme
MARIPLIVSRPGALPEGHHVDEYAGLTDVAPTIVDAIGGEISSLRPDGASLLPLLSDGSWNEPRDAWFGVLGRGAEAVYAAFDDQVKYIYSAGDDVEYALAVTDSTDETQRLAPTNPLFHHAMRLGETLRERLAKEGLTHVLSGDAWRRFQAASVGETDADRDRECRGSQFAEWVEAVGPCH